MKRVFVVVGVFLLLSLLNLNAYTHWYDRSVFLAEDDTYRILSTSSNLSGGQRLRPEGSILRENEVDVALFVYHVAVGREVSITPGLVDLRFVGEEHSYPDEHGLLEQEVTTTPMGVCEATGDALYLVEVRLRLLTPEKDIRDEIPRDIRSVAFTFSIDIEE